MGETRDTHQPLSLCYHLFNNLHETSMDIGDFYDLACFNSLNPSAFSPNFGPKQTPKTPNDPLDLLALFRCLGVVAQS